MKKRTKKAVRHILGKMDCTVRDRLWKVPSSDTASRLIKTTQLLASPADARAFEGLAAAPWASLRSVQYFTDSASVMRGSRSVFNFFLESAG
jgi:hypothetical protein